jgi:hypothetical protein
MSLVRLLGFATLQCGCVVGRYLELASSREVIYVEEKGAECEVPQHRRNHALPRRFSGAVPVVVVARAS